MLANDDDRLTSNTKSSMHTKGADAFADESVILTPSTTEALTSQNIAVDPASQNIAVDQCALHTSTEETLASEDVDSTDEYMMMYESGDEQDQSDDEDERRLERRWISALDVRLQAESRTRLHSTQTREGRRKPFPPKLSPLRRTYITPSVHRSTTKRTNSASRQLSQLALPREDGVPRLLHEPNCASITLDAVMGAYRQKMPPTCKSLRSGAQASVPNQPMPTAKYTSSTTTEKERSAAVVQPDVCAQRACL
jgi:hypothetical protein